MWGKNWTYAHNGQLSDFRKKLALKHHIPVGETDSEHAFCWLLDCLYQTFAEQQPDAKTLFNFIANKADVINELGVFNMLLSDGDYIFAFCSTQLHWLTRKAPFGQASLIDTEMTVNFTEETTEKDVVTVIATQPLTDDENWHKMLPASWCLFYLGELVATSAVAD
jgi:glutamine amidotransferase